MSIAMELVIGVAFVIFIVIGTLFILWNYHMYQAHKHLSRALMLMEERRKDNERARLAMEARHRK